MFVKAMTVKSMNEQFEYRLTQTRCHGIRLQAMLIAIVGCMMTGVGCESPQARIRENPELFATFPVDVQEKVKQGVVDVGFTKDMVLLSQGQPDRRIASKDATGVVSESWVYTDIYYTHVPVYHNHHYRRSYRNRYGDCDSYYFDRAWEDVPHEYDRLTLRFEGDRVASLNVDER